MNLVDRTIAFFAPGTGLRRANARMALDMVRNYEGAKLGRRTENWRASNTSANAAVKGSLPRLRARSRDVVRNTWWGARAIDVFCAHAVGTGITPTVKTGNKKADRRAVALFKEWGKRCDAEGQLDINGLIALATREIAESGEVLIRRIPVRPEGRKVPLEIQLLEPDHLDATRDRVGSDAVVDQGIEYGLNGKRRKYWLLPEHPGARGISGRSTSIGIDARDVLHAYRKLRIGQGRGVPFVASVLIKGRDLADLEDAISVKAKVEACLAAFVQTTEQSRTLGQTAEDKDKSARRVETLSPGMINYMGPGETVQTIAPSSSFAFERILVNTWMALAAGMGLTYDQLTGDLRQANYSSLRAGKIEFRRLIEQFQWLTLVAMVLDPLWDWFIESAMDSGALPRRAGGYPVEWIMPAVEPIDPLKDLQADVLAVRTGRMTWPQFVAAWGFEPDAQLDEISDWFKALDAKGVTLDADPRRPVKGIKGAVSSNDPGDDEPAKQKETDDDE